MFLLLQVSFILRLSFTFGEDAAESVPLQTWLMEPQGASCLCAGLMGEVGGHCAHCLESPSVGGTAVLRKNSWVC